MIMAPTAPMAYKACSELSMSGNAMPESKYQHLAHCYFTRLNPKRKGPF